MLVVFLQVLVVAVLGLGAIARDRQEARRSAEENARSDADTALVRLVGKARQEVLSALDDVRHNPEFDHLDRLRSGHGRHSDLVKTVYQVDPETGEFFWMDGVHRLYVPSARRDALIEYEKANPDVVEQMERSYHHARTRADRIHHGVAFFREFPYRMVEDGFPVALGGIGGLVDLAFVNVEEIKMSGSPPDVEEAYRLLERVLLAAIEITALNQDRKTEIPSADRSKLEEVPATVGAAIMALLPEQMRIRRHVEACRDAQINLEGRPPDATSLQPALAVALGQIGEEDGVAHVGGPMGGHLIGLVPDARVPGAETARHILVVMSPEAMLHLLRDAADPNRLAQLGLSAYVAPVEDLPADRVVVQQDLRQVEGLKLPYRVEFHCIEEPDLPVEGPGEYFYWGIIALSAAGLGMGGYVLMRLYTREVRIARLKADFVSNLSHELKTPLTSIAMFAEMLQEGQLSSPEHRKEGLDILVQESERLQAIVRRMLDTAKREARGVDYERTPGDLNAVVGKAAERFRHIVTEPGLDLVVELHPESLPVQLDRAAIDDVVSNLVSNAWKYKRGAEAHIEVRTARRGRRAEITVADDGPGIPRQERRKVFEMFYRADAYLTRAAGTGLGLSLVRTIVRAHRGTVRIETGLNGQGTLFRIRIPTSRAAAASLAASSAVSLGSVSPNPEATT